VSHPQFSTISELSNTHKPCLLSSQRAEKRKSKVPSACPDIIKISSDESEPEAEDTKPKGHAISKKRTLSAPTNDQPSKKQLTKVEVIEILDSDDDVPMIKPEILASTIPTSSGSKKEDIKMEEVSSYPHSCW
jgi:hypothetical protein